MSIINVAAIQMEPEPGQPKRNLDLLLDLAGQAATAGADLIVAPELATTGYCWPDRAAVAPYVEPIPGPTTAAVHRLAANTGTVVALGMAEVEPGTGVFYNSAVLVGPGGLIGKYRKVQPYLAEPRWAKHGDLGFPVFTAGDIRIGLMICMDAVFPEPARSLAVGGADLICVPVNWFGESAPSAFWRARARENGVALIVANRWGQERGTQFAAGSSVIDSSGTDLIVAEAGDGFAIARLDLHALRQSRGTALAGRRPDRYHDLVLDPYCWNPLETFGLYGDLTLPPGRPARIGAMMLEPISDADRWSGTVLSLVGDQQLDLLAVPPPATRAGEPIPGPMSDRIVRMAADTGGLIATEVIEQSGSDQFRTVVLVNQTGLVGRYRSVHVTGDLTPGDDWFHIDTDFGRIGLLTGTDLLYPESARVLALKGCDLVCCPLNDQPAVTSWSPARVRAGENNIFLAAGSLTGAGEAGLFSPDAFRSPPCEATTDRPGITSLTMDVTRPDCPVPTATARLKPLLAMRQTNWFNSLVRNGKP